MQQALRVGKRVRTETGIDGAGRDMVTAALDLGLARAGIALDAARALVVGAGAMGGLALATLRRAGVPDRMVANRSAARADRLAAEHDATAITMSSCAEALRHVDLVVVATSSTEPVLTAADLPPTRERPLLILDLGLPRDVDPAVGDVPGVTLVDIASMRDTVTAPHGVDIAAAEAMIAEEAAAFRRQVSGLTAGPAVIALRARADDLIATELGVLCRRHPDLSDAQRADVARTVHRVVQRLLHPPIVRMRERAADPDGDRYSALVRELFDLSSGQDRAHVPAVGKARSSPSHGLRATPQ
jgi:glutamyl-tRNA reductase